MQIPLLPFGPQVAGSAVRNPVVVNVVVTGHPLGLSKTGHASCRPARPVAVGGSIVRGTVMVRGSSVPWRGSTTAATVASGAASRGKAGSKVMVAWMGP